MTQTPFNHYTNDELLMHIACKSDVSDEELELAHRLEHLLYDQSDSEAVPERPNLRALCDGDDT